MKNNLIKFIIKNKFLLILFLIIALTSIIRWHYLPLTPVYCDEVFSIYAAKGIIENGIPVFPSGAIYSRDPLFHYLLALLVFLFGENIIAYRLISFIFGALVLILVYFFAKRFTNKYVAIFAVLFLAISRFENTFVYLARMYIQFQFFWLLTIYCFYQGIIKGNSKYKILTFLSYILSLFSHKATLTLLPILGLYLIFKKRDFYKDKIILTGSILIIFISLFLYFIKIPGSLDCFIVPDVLGFSFKELSYYPEILFSSTLFFSVFIFISFIKLFKKKEQKRFYLFWVFLSSLFLITILTKTKSVFYAANFFPIYVILVLLGINDFLEFLKNMFKFKKSHLFLISFIILFLPVLMSYLALSSCPYGFKSLGRDSKSPHEYLLKNKADEDLVITTVHSVTLFYLGIENKDKIYLLREKQEENGAWQEFREDKREPYFGIVLIDSLDKLKNFLENNKRVWVLTDYRISWLVSPEVGRYIRENLELRYSNKDKDVNVYFYESPTKRINH